MATSSERVRSTNVPACKLDTNVDSMRVPTLELHETVYKNVDSEKVSTVADTNVDSTRDPTVEQADTNYDALSGSGKSDGPCEPTENDSLRYGETNPNWNGKYIPAETDKISPKKIAEIYENCQTVNILITGLTGSGKSGLTIDIRGRGMGNGARAHNHFCVMPEVDLRYGSRHPANPAGNVITNIHSSPLGLRVLC